MIEGESESQNSPINAPSFFDDPLHSVFDTNADSLPINIDDVCSVFIIFQWTEVGAFKASKLSDGKESEIGFGFHTTSTLCVKAQTKVKANVLGTAFFKAEAFITAIEKSIGSGHPRTKVGSKLPRVLLLIDLLKREPDAAQARSRGIPFGNSNLCSALFGLKKEQKGATNEDEFHLPKNGKKEVFLKESIALCFVNDAFCDVFDLTFAMCFAQLNGGNAHQNKKQSAEHGFDDGMNTRQNFVQKARKSGGFLF